MPGAVNTVVPSTYGPVYDSTKKKNDLFLAAAAKAGHRIIRIYGYNTVPDHSNRQCVDEMGTDGKTAVNHPMMDWSASYLKSNKAALGVEGVIWNRRVMGFPSQGPMYRGPEGVFRPYSGPNPHTDHVHVQYNTSAVGGGLTTTAPSKPARKMWSGGLWVLKSVPGYDGSGKRRTDLDLKAGQWVQGTVDDTKFDDGRYFRVGKIPHRVWYPLDNGNWSHEKNGSALHEAGRSIVSSASVAAIAKAAKLDPARNQGGTTSGSVDDVKVVEDALQRAGLLSKKYAADGSFGSSSVAAYAKWQKKLGYRGKDADGIPGEASLKKLGAKYGFDVKK